jgi:glycosyltransferase involved in cell wall biosynthesis
VRFSVIVPVYNVAQYLGKCLESLQKQSWKDYEVICINDGSTDDSRSILAEWAQRFPEMTVIDQENGGLSAARNTGLKAAQGEYVVFVDSDDFVEPSMLSLLAGETGPYDVICYSSRRTDNGAYDILVAEQTNGWDYYNRHALEARHVPFVCVWQRCYRRDFLLEKHLFFREGILHEDNEFTPRVCLKAQKVKTVPDVLYNYRVRSNSIMTNRGLHSKESLILISNQLSKSFIQESNIEKDVIYQSLTQYYQMAFIDNTRKEDRHLRPMMDWQCYHQVSRSKLRHRINYILIRISASLFRLSLRVL